MIIQNIHNAFTVVVSHEFKIVCDPWISDGIFDGGWGKFPPVENIEKYLDNTTHCFISHIHEDHFDLDAIKLLDKNVKFLIPDIYPNHVIKNTIKELGFNNIKMLKVDTSYEIEKGLFFDVIPPMNSKGLETFDNDYSGDLGFLSVDAGIMIKDKDGKIVLLSDNGPYELSDEMINKIKGCDILAFPFNGVADDYPVCFDNLTLQQKKKKSLERQEKRTELQCDSIIKIQPKNLIPYSSDMVVLGKRAKDFVDVHPIEYLVRDKVSKIYEERTNIPTHAIYSEDIISILDGDVIIDESSKLDLNIKDYAYSKHNEDVNNNIIYSEVDSFYTLYDNFVQSCDNMFKVMKKLKLKIRMDFIFYITDMDEYLTVDIGNKHISKKKSTNKNLQLCNIRSGYLNSHFLFIHHWNNSIISYNLDWERKNDVYDYGLNKGLNFYTLEEDKMNKDNIIIYVSSRNNYDMLSGEVFKNIDTEGFEFINVDDKSSVEEIEKGKKMCEENDVVFLENKSRGCQMATQTLIDFIKENRPNCKWIFCFQHDCYPITKNFFSRINKLINDGRLDEFGTLGFNRIDMGKHTPGAYDKWVNGEKPIGHLGLAHLSILNESGRWLQPNRNAWLLENNDWRKPLSVEINAWTSFGINVNKWNKFIEPTDEYHFHLWAPDISIQFLYHNCHNLVLPDLYLMNKQELKSKYSIDENSAHSAKKGNEYHFGHYEPSHKTWKERWGWDYRNPSTIPGVIQSYEGTLIEEFINHNTKSGPLKTFNLGEY